MATVKVQLLNNYVKLIIITGKIESFIATFFYRTMELLSIKTEDFIEIIFNKK
jgi:hypothetical protein